MLSVSLSDLLLFVGVEDDDARVGEGQAAAAPTSRMRPF
jgi:hypothetical protein